MEAEARRDLLRIARSHLQRATGAAADPVEPPTEPSTLLEPAAAFVSLHDREGAVRGCVGTTQATRPLADVVAEMAEAAALRDPRFPPVTADEVSDLHIEISVLGPLEEITELSDVEIGRHGLVVEGWGRRGLLLPQVARERDVDAERFVELTCRKAGLPPRAYQEGEARLFRFGADVFGEDS